MQAQVLAPGGVDLLAAILTSRRQTAGHRQRQRRIGSRSLCLWSRQPPRELPLAARPRRKQTREKGKKSPWFVWAGPRCADKAATGHPALLLLLLLLPLCLLTQTQSATQQAPLLTSTHDGRQAYLPVCLVVAA